MAYGHIIAFLLGIPFGLAGAEGVSTEAAKVKTMCALTAKSISKPKNVTRASTGDGDTVTSRTRTQNVAVNVNFFQQQSSEYEIQCFFFAQMDTTKFLYDVQTIKSSSARQDVVLTSALTESVARSRMYSFTINTSFEIIRGTVEQTLSVSNGKVYGWVVRVVQDGKTVKFETNQGPLKVLTQKDPGFLDEAAGNFKK